MNDRPNIIYFLILLWLALSFIFIIWGGFSFVILVQIESWVEDLRILSSQVFFGYLVSTIVWFVFSSLFLIFAYATFRGDNWCWTTGLIISTIFLIIFGFMLASFMVTSVLFFDWFSVYGLITVVLSFLTDLGIIFLITRPKTKLYFAIGRPEEKNLV
jgi:hypothetical protein